MIGGEAQLRILFIQELRVRKSLGQGRPEIGGWKAGEIRNGLEETGVGGRVGREARITARSGRKRNGGMWWENVDCVPG